MTSIPVGTKVRTKVPLSIYPAGTETYVLAGETDTVTGYEADTVREVGLSVGFPAKYALDLRGNLGCPLLVAESEVEVLE